VGFGDELMVTGHVREMQKTDPRKVRLDYAGKKIWNEVFDHNPRIAGPQDSDVQVYQPRVNGLRPYCAGKSPERWIWRDYSALQGEIYFQLSEQVYAATVNPGIVIEPNLKANASPNKDWGWKRWAQLVEMLRANGYRVSQLGLPGMRLVKGAEPILTPTFRLAAAILAKAPGAVLSEGGLHHAAAAVGTPAVVIFGGYISPRQTGYDAHVNLFTGGTPCGMRIPCDHCAKAMAAITPQDVLAELKRVIRK
jgi:ADP-heptose:LPS heptosyltransferase